MKCSNCNEEIGECTVCPYCKSDVTKMNTTQKNQTINKQADEKNRTLFVVVFKFILIAILGISALICLVSNEISSGIVCIILATIIYIILTIFETIIDLLQQINNKL